MTTTAPAPGATTAPAPKPTILSANGIERKGNILVNYITSTDHKTIGYMYLIASFVYFLIGGVMALIIRAQLFEPGLQVVGTKEQYNQLFTMHGTIMLLMFATPLFAGFANVLMPLQIGAPDVAFPRLNALAYWFYSFGSLIAVAGFLTPQGAASFGWFAYAPLSSTTFSPGIGGNLWVLGLGLSGFGTILGAVNFITTIITMRAPGMTMFRMPIFTWNTLVTSILVLMAFPVLAAAMFALAADRVFDAHIYDAANGGALLWQHLFWFFGHPEVYIIFLPATGFVSSIVVAFAQRPAFGYLPLVLALVATAFLSFGLWVHHMFATGLPQLGASFFTASSMLIAVPSGIQIFCWIATLWGRRPAMATPMLFVMGFLVIFVMGGMTGVMVASVPLDLQVHDTYFVVAHFHYVLIGGAVFPLLGAFYFWYPKFTGRMMSERLGRWNFWLAFVGFNLTFFVMHVLGLMGMPRRVYTYPSDSGWGPLNMVSSIGSVMLAASFGLFFVNALWSLRRGVRAPSNPWNAGTLEWALPSPPPAYNFARIPIVTHHEPLWKERESLPVAHGLAVDEREILVSTLVEARPDLREVVPGSSIWPLISAIALSIAFVASIFSPYAALWGGALVGAALLGWFWPKSSHEDEE